MEQKKAVSAKVFDIQGFSVHDGPGARTLVFLKGCTLHCFWCSNPEGLRYDDDLFFNPDRCALCGECIHSCPAEAIQITGGVHSIRRDGCLTCSGLPCVDACSTGALQRCGQQFSVEELFALIRRDRHYWGEGGGVTLTGGEPLRQIDFVALFLEKCYTAFIHTAIETCGNVPWSHFERAIPFLDWMFFDLKAGSTGLHKTGTGSGNEEILQNVHRLNETFRGELVFRMPLIPGFNDHPRHLSEIAEIISGTRWKTINLLPLHHLGENKYRRLGLTYQGAVIPEPLRDTMLQAKSIMEKSGIECYQGNETWF